MNEPYQALAAITENCAPVTLLSFGRLGHTVAERWSEQHQCVITTLTPTEAKNELTLTHPQDLALITDTLEHLSVTQGQRLLGQLRNYGTRQIAVVLPENSAWTLTDFIALGFRREAVLQQTDRKFLLYTYNIESYNHKRTWNNPRFWANPERWGKHRW
ncbi:DUF6231 family protein [Marinimicrobium sp. ABcell2]|uniref:DUF6231 family protein n=1 Tax=Marinimicrobium sp. ABcell2 TaxID=3069751 RepID=UPI0027AFBE1A|nr:DUF6231 family protein [Marinimicrobium sp. ABcell2]MDQ2075764.1 DUF6231 family protein [Marinimicrobium sp. ABcell2]